MSENRIISKADKWLWAIFIIGLLLVVAAILNYSLALSAMFAPGGQSVEIWTPIAVTAIVVFVYLIPTILGRKKRKSAAIAVLNIYLGWTVIGWIVALVWSSLGDRD